MRFWTSDLHFGHKNIIEYTGRPFSSTEEMDEELIRRWNSVLTLGDTVWFLGDFSLDWKKLAILNRLNFAKFDWILGNHDDKKKILRELKTGGCISNLVDKLTIHEGGLVDIDGVNFVVTHAPLDALFDSPILCGHVHEKWRYCAAGTILTEEGRNRLVRRKRTLHPAINVGVDAHDFYPITDSKIMEIYNKISSY